MGTLKDFVKKPQRPTVGEKREVVSYSGHAEYVNEMGDMRIFSPKVKKTITYVCIDNGADTGSEVWEMFTVLNEIQV